MPISKEELIRLRREYPKGSKVELINMDDKFAPAKGTIGKVNFVDDIGSIHVTWNTGSTLAVVYGVDKCRRID